MFDRLYCFPTDGIDRRAAQTVLHHTLDVVVKTTAPIVPIFSDDCYVHRYGTQLGKGGSGY